MAGTAEAANQHVDRFVAAARHEDLLLVDAVEPRELDQRRSAAAADTRSGRVGRVARARQGISLAFRRSCRARRPQARRAACRKSARARSSTLIGGLPRMRVETFLHGPRVRVEALELARASSPPARSASPSNESSCTVMSARSPHAEPEYRRRTRTSAARGSCRCSSRRPTPASTGPGTPSPRRTRGSQSRGRSICRIRCSGA